MVAAATSLALPSTSFTTSTSARLSNGGLTAVPSSSCLCSRAVACRRQLLGSAARCKTEAAGNRRQVLCAASPLPAGSSSTLPEKQKEDAPHTLTDHFTVGDCMTKGELITATVNTTVDEALEALVEHRITGMPVVDEEGKLVGVVSDYDLLALDSISGKRDATPPTSLFPEANSTWKAFKEIHRLLLKTHGRTVGELMTPNPLVVRPMTNLEDAARILLDSKFRRLPVVDETGRLVGLLTRGNVVSAALMMKRANEGKGVAPSGGN